MNHPLKNALPIVAAAYGEKFGVKVLIQGQDAFTVSNAAIAFFNIQLVIADL